MDRPPKRRRWPCQAHSDGEIKLSMQISRDFQEVWGTDHIKVEHDGERVQVVVDDYEVFDFLDDFMTDAGLEYDYRSEEDRHGRKHFLMHFRPTISAEQVSDTLKRIDAEEVNRIWSLNNP